MMERVEAGEDPNEPEEVIVVNRASIEVTVQNGSGSTGAASKLGDTLKELGYDVVDTGNADSTVYSETLVIYHDTDFEDAAKVIISDMHCGRAVFDSTEFYEFEGDVLVVIGTDWMS